MHAGNGFPVPQRGLVSTNRGHHFIFEDNTFEWANSVGLDIGNEDWAASRPPQPVGFDVFAAILSATAASRALAAPAARNQLWSKRTCSSGSAGRMRP